MKRLKLLGILGMCCLMLWSCGRTEKEEETGKPVIIPAVFGVDPETGRAENKELVEAFNEAYEGIYRVETEWITESADGYRELLKQLNAQDKLPAIITNAAMDEEFYQMLVKNERLVNLSEYMDEEWRGMIREDIMKECTHENGNVYLSPIVSPVYSYSGIYYNRELLAAAGYETIPDDWEGFFECMDALLEKGTTPLALHGSGTFWSAMLLSTAYCAKTEAGTEFLQRQFPLDYSQEPGKSLFEFLKTIYNYTYYDALDIDYEKAQARFYDDKAAMLVNGYWIMETMEEEKQEKFAFAPFPGKVMMASPEMTAWAITEGHEEEVIKGAAEFLKFRAEASQRDSEAFLNSLGTPLIQDYKEAIKEVKRVIPNYQLKWEQDIQNEFFNEYLPGYIHGELSLEEFLGKLNETAQQIAREKEV